MFFTSFLCFFYFYKAKGNSRHPLCKPGSSKHFFEIFPNFIWESSLNIYYLDKPGLLRNWNSLFNKSYYKLFKLIKIWRVWKSSDSQFYFQKNHDNFSLIIIDCSTKTNIKQNFVKEKITVIAKKHTAIDHLYV